MEVLKNPRYLWYWFLISSKSCPSLVMEFSGVVMWISASEILFSPVFTQSSRYRSVIAGGQESELAMVVVEGCGFEDG